MPNESIASLLCAEYGTVNSKVKFSFVNSQTGTYEIDSYILVLCESVALGSIPNGPVWSFLEDESRGTRSRRRVLYTELTHRGKASSVLHVERD